MELTNKQICAHYFTIGEDGYTCRCKTLRQQETSGYTNLMNHIKNEHPDYENEVTASVVDPQRTLAEFGVTTVKG